MSMPLLGICVPTFNRCTEVAPLLACLDAELPAAGDTFVLVSDNASTDGTWELLREGARTRPWLQLHRQPENTGLAGNMGWLVEHAPPCEYLWCFGDDDRLLPGSLRTIVDVLRAERPSWLWLPYIGVDAAHERELTRSPAPAACERFDTPAELWQAYHHWLTFITASIVRRADFREAVAAVPPGVNAYTPLLWYFRAGLAGPCVVLGEHVLTASQEVSWLDRAHVIQTLDYTRLWEDGLKDGMSAKTFGSTLDDLYRDGWGRTLWERHPIELLAQVVARFPQSRSLRDYLWTMAEAQGRGDVLPVLAEAARATGDAARAAEHVEHGEQAFAVGDGETALACFAAAVAVDPTCVDAWNDAAVVLFALGRHVGAAQRVASALFVAPEDPSARENHEAILRRS